MFRKYSKIIDSQFLIRVIRNEVSQEEKEYFYSWLSESEKNKEDFGNLLLLWDKLDNAILLTSSDIKEQWAALQKRITIQEENFTQPIIKLEEKTDQKKPNPPKQIGSAHYFYPWILRIVALVIIISGLTFLIRKNDIKISEKELVSTSSEFPQYYYELITHKGERKVFPLADGSIVYLNADSKLIYPTNFSSTERTVELVGEAYFSVSKDEQRPFKVLSGKTATIVTGTEFNVKFRNNKISVVVTKGSVKTCLRNSDDGIPIKKGQVIYFSENNGFSKPFKADFKHFLAWRDGQFSFEQTPLREAMEEIERFYNLEVVFKNKTVANKTITGVFKTDSFDQILTIISLTLDVKIDYVGRKIIIQ